MSLRGSIKRWKVPLISVGLTGASAFGIGAILKHSAERSRLELGRKLVLGVEPLKGRMVGHDLDLPTATVRCQNCHKIGQEPGKSFAPRLSQASLTGLVKRRGGPPSRYDVATFCGVLADGVDPAHVMIPQTMPRYNLTEQECAALWTYVTAN